MKHCKRTLSLLLIVVLLLGCIIPGVSAAAPTRTEKAKVLFELGLFQGYDSTGNNFGLNDRATREHALVFLLRMLGKDSAAKSWTGPQPYSDVPGGNWARSYIGYAKQTGLTVGIGNNKFGLGRYATMQEMTMFALRGLGYSDASGVKDFNYNTSLAFAKSKGILSSSKAITPFTRGVAVDIIYGSLFANIKNQNYTLIERLVSDGAVTEKQLRNAEKIIPGLFGGTTSTSTVITANFDVVNHTGKTIQALYMTTSGTADWGSNLLPQNGDLTSNGSVTLSVGFDKRTQYDILAKYADGSESDFRGLSFADCGKDGGVIQLKSGTALLYPQYNVTVQFVNLTGKAITALYSSATQVDSWGSTLGSVAVGDTLRVVFPLTAYSLVYDLRADCSGESFEFKGLDFSNVSTTGATLYLYVENGIPMISATKPASNLEAESKALTNRYNQTITRYNNLVDQVNKKEALRNDTTLVNDLNSITAELETMGKVIGEGTGIYTAAQITEYNTALDYVDGIMKSLEALLAVV